MYQKESLLAVEEAQVTEAMRVAFEEVLSELRMAQRMNHPMVSLHEGLSVIQEEVYELMLEVYKNPQKHPDRALRARKEAIQVAAMAIRLMVDML